MSEISLPTKQGSQPRQDHVPSQAWSCFLLAADRRAYQNIQSSRTDTLWARPFVEVAHLSILYASAVLTASEQAVSPNTKVCVTHF